MDSYFIFHNISPENTNNINTTQGENKFTSNQHYHYLQQIISDHSDNDNTTPSAEAEEDEMENITASVEEVTLSETTPDEQRKSTLCMRPTENEAANNYYNYMKSKLKSALSIVRVIHPGSHVKTDYSRITNSHTTSAPDYSVITNNHTTSAPSETRTPTKEFQDTPGGDGGTGVQKRRITFMVVKKKTGEGWEG